MLLLLWGCGRPRLAARALVEKHSRVSRTRLWGAPAPSYPRVTTPYTRLTRAYTPLQKRHSACGLTVQVRRRGVVASRITRRLAANQCQRPQLKALWRQFRANCRISRLKRRGHSPARSRPPCAFCDCFSVLKQIARGSKLREGPTPESDSQEIGKAGPDPTRTFALASSHDDSSLTYQRARSPSQARLHPAGAHRRRRGRPRLRP